MYEPLRRVERSIPGIPLIASSALLCCGALSLSVDASLRHTTMALFVSIFDPSVKQKYVDLLAICLDLLAIWGTVRTVRKPNEQLSAQTERERLPFEAAEARAN